VGAKALAAVLLAASLACGGAGERLVERLEVRLALQADGSLEVSEIWLVDVDPGTPWTFTRTLPREHHDGLSTLQASPPGLVEQGKAPSVSWAIGPGWGAGLQSLTVRYVATNALAIGPGRARLSWPLLLPSHRWRIKQAYLHFESPAGVAPVTPGGIAEPGWGVTERPTGVQAIRANVGPGEPVTVSFEFSRDALKLQEPRWQFLAERAQEFKPAFASAAASIILVGLAVLGLIRVLVSDHARGAARRGLRTAGIVFLLLGPVLAAVVRLTLDGFGPWAMSVPASVAIVGVMFLIAGSVQRTQDPGPRT
jgi:hypothetical protein